MFFALFGALWLAGGTWLTHQGRPWLYGLIGLVGAALLATALRVARQQRPSTASAATPERRRVSRWFQIINAAQWILILVGINVLNNLGLRRWTLPFAILILGLHFLPLARLFQAREHYLTGGALVLLALCYPLLTGNPESAAGPVAAGLILWAAALWALRPGSTGSG